MSTATTHDEHHDHHGPEPGLLRWVYTTNAKDIGTLYLLLALLMFFIGGAMAMYIRAELFQPGIQFSNPDFFNQMTTMHALVMIYPGSITGVSGCCHSPLLCCSVRCS